MIYKYFKTLALVVFAGLAITSKGQSTVFVETFGTITAPAWTSTLNSSHTQWDADASDCGSCFGTIPECTIAGSSSLSVVYSLNSGTGTYTMKTNNINTTNFTNMFLSWNGLRQSGAPTITVSVSSNGGTSWTNISFTDVATDNAWHALTPISIPSFCEGVSNFQIRWQYTGDASGNYFALDDIYVTGSPFTFFYLVAGVNPAVITDWGTNTNGGGLNPTSFTNGGQTFYMDNNATVTLNSAWTFGGSGSLLIVGNGQNTNFNINSSLTFINGAQMEVKNSSTVTCLSVASATSVTGGDVILDVGSTVDFAQTTAGCQIWDAVYDNLTISGGVDKSSGASNINNVLFLNGANLIMSNSSAQTLRLFGTISGTGIIKTGNSNLQIGGTGTLGTLTFGTGGTTQSINQFIMSRTASGLVTLGSSLTVNGNATFSNGKLDLNNKALQLNGKITFPVSAANGTLKGSKTSTLGIGGSGTITNSLFMDQTSSTTKAMGEVVMNRSGVTLPLGNAMEMWGDLTPTAGTFGAGANLTVKSDASNKGRIGIMGASGSLTGSPTIEVYKPSGLTGWVLLCAPGTTAKTMADWNSSFAITCATCPDGSTVGGQTFTSIYGYDETAAAGSASAAAHYIELDVTAPLNNGINSAIDPTLSYWVYLGNGYPNTSAITIPLTGAIQQGNLSAVPCTLTGGVNTENGWNLLSNPYPSPILVSGILGNATGSFDNTILVYDPDTDSNIPFTAAGTNSVIPMGQGFMIRSTGGTAINPIETWKTTFNSNTAIEWSTSSKPFYYGDFLLNLTSSTVTKNFFTQAYFSFDGTNGFDNGKDAVSLVSSVDPGTPRIYSTTGGIDWLKNSLPALNGTINIPVTVFTGTAGTFSIKPENLNMLPSGACVKLYDIANNFTHDLKTGAYTTTVAANITTAQFELRITLNPTSMTSSFTNPVCKKSNNGSIVANGSTSGPWNYTWKDANYTVLKTTNNATGPDTLKNAFYGTYYVDVNTVGTCDNATNTVTLVYTTPVANAAFSVNYDTLSIYGTTQFLFNNTSTNATAYKWTFGDLSTSTAQSPSYLYKKEGDYDVTLLAMNPACNDTSKYVYMVHATAKKPQVGIAKISATDNNIKVGKDANGAYVQFNFDKLTKGTVSVSNILGQVILSPKTVEGSVERFYIDLSSAKDQLLFITVDTDNKHLTLKLFNN